ncbi:HD-GYP domain-containing protein [Selenomonas ruminantium]|uniref:HD-GYP domain-containing protein n=1 Tax=Selenomonas ruminantium TaxID=971 RepID=UPI0026EA8C70|nr:HD domain-containing phosphohydrolase [Selenomonas ruminantium]
MRAVSVEDLKPGMILARTIVNDDMVVVLSEDTLLTKAHLTRLTFLNIPVVYIKDEYELSRNYQTASSIFNRSNAFVKEYDSVVQEAKSIFEETEKSGNVPLAETQDMVKEAIAPMARNSGAIDYLYELNHRSSDLYNHALRVSILAGVIAKWMHFKRAKTRELILSGFLHDIGKCKFPQRLLDKNINNLQGEDYEAYIKHTVDGQHILNGVAGLSDGIKLAALQHHERMDGTGFPFGNSGTDIHEYARIIMIADLYDNITTERQGYVKQTPFAAIAQLTENMYTSLDPEVCVPVLTHIKDAFLGSRITLNTGEKGIIAAYPNDFAAHPIVSMSSGMLINLNEHPELVITEYNPK